MSKIGFAATKNGDIHINTVSDTRRGALVNWLVTVASRMIYSTDTDEMIERCFALANNRLGGETTIEYVAISSTDGKPRGS